jgi:hypothetical protein
VVGDAVIEAKQFVGVIVSILLLDVGRRSRRTRAGRPGRAHGHIGADRVCAHVLGGDGDVEQVCQAVVFREGI